MVATSILHKWEVVPNSAVKEVLFQTPNTADATNTLVITLADYGIAANGLLSVDGYVHTTDGSVITKEDNTTVVAAGVLTVTIAAGTDNDTRVVKIVGTSSVNTFA